jgi:DNA polymerase elongation subunit (family B)
MKYYRNIYYDTRQSKVYLWDYNGNLVQEPWAPYVFEHTNKNTGIHSIYHKSVDKIVFDTYKEYKNYQKSFDTVLENSVPPVIQYLTERYTDNDDLDLPKLHICFIDIETPHNDGFPDVERVPAPIVLISIIDEDANRTIFGIGEYNGKYKDKVKYINCRDEIELLNVFFDWMSREQFDVITGWNISPDSKMNKYGGFDIPYIIRRSIKLFGEEGSNHRKLSPVNTVRIWETKGVKDSVYNVDIAGISVIDYLGLYKWFSFNNLESFTLEYVASVELKKHKLDYSKYDTMYDFYQQDWNGFVDYCMNDSDLVYDLEKKLGYINLAQMLTCYCGCQMKNFNASVPLIEGLMLKHFRKNNLCAPRLNDGEQKWFPAAYVKEPFVGMHQDVVDLDIASSYPTHIIILNMSLETYFGRIIGFDKKDVKDYYTNKGIHEPLHKGRPIYNMNVEYTRKRDFPNFALLTVDNEVVWYSGEKLEMFNKALERKLLCIAPNGAVFKTKPKGVIAHVEQSTFNERVKQKGLKSKYKNKAKEDPDNADHWKEMSQNRHVLQWAIKILINSMFGVMGVPYCRYHNIHMAEAITSCGRHTIQQCEVFTDELLNEPTEGIKNIVNEIKKIDIS